MIKALVFDVFGTVVDWRTSVIEECISLEKHTGISGDWEKLTDMWRQNYMPSMDKVRNGEREWVNLDTLHKESLINILKESKYSISTLSNGGIDLLSNMAIKQNLPWDNIFSAETFLHYKPDPETYLGAAKILKLLPEEVMLVAAHNQDLLAAKKYGLKTAFVLRSNEYGPNQDFDLEADEKIDVSASNFIELFDKLNSYNT